MPPTPSLIPESGDNAALLREILATLRQLPASDEVSTLRENVQRLLLAETHRDGLVKELHAKVTQLWESSLLNEQALKELFELRARIWGIGVAAVLGLAAGGTAIVNALRP